MSVWSLSTTSSAPSYDRGHAFATKPVRDLCEAITEIPVSLDSICGKGIAVTSNKEWMEEIFENFSDGWLDDVICAVVEDFLNKKVLGLHLVAPSNKSLDESTWGEVWEQLRADVSYVHNVVSAVRDKDIPLLEHVYQRLQQMSPPLLRSFVVRDVIYK